MEPCTARAGDVILHKGSPSRSLLLVEAGEVEVLDDGVGKALVLGRIGPGGVVGEVGFIDGQARTHHVRALVDCRLRRLAREGLLRLAKGDSELFAKLTIALAQVVARRYRAAMEELEPVALLRGVASRAALVRARRGNRPFPGNRRAPSDGPAGDAPRAQSAGPPEEEATQALELLKDVARRALEGRVSNPGV